jgi:hypothetical protein
MADNDLSIVAEGSVCQNGTQNGFSSFDRHEAVLHLDRVGRISTIRGREIIITPGASINWEMARFLLAGIMIGAALHQRQYLVLHASVVEISGKAVAFVASSGHGKSTMGGALYAQGHRLLTDDLAALDLSSGIVRVLPSYPWIKLHPQVADRLGLEDPRLPIAFKGQRKQCISVQKLFSHDPLPLAAIYLLGVNETCTFRQVDRREGLIQLLSHTLPTQILWLGDGLQLSQLAKLLATVPVYRFERNFESFDLLRHVELVKDHFASRHDRSSI